MCQPLYSVFVEVVWYVLLTQVSLDAHVEKWLAASLAWDELEQPSKRNIFKQQNIRPTSHSTPLKDWATQRHTTIKYSDFFFSSSESDWETTKVGKGNDKIPDTVVILLKKKWPLNLMTSGINHLYSSRQGDGPWHWFTGKCQQPDAHLWFQQSLPVVSFLIMIRVTT